MANQLGIGQLDQIQNTCEALKLRRMQQIFEHEAERATAEQCTYLEYLEHLLEEELQDKQSRNIALKTRVARFPYHKTLSDFDFGFQPSLDARKIKDLATLRFLQEAENVILLGPPGVGKTHLAVSLGLEAITNGFTVSFIPLQALLVTLNKAYQENQLEGKLKSYLRPRLLILDEVGYVPLNTREVNFLFQVISGRYEEGSIILTSNKSYGEWGTIFGDKVIAAAMLDRLLHHSHTISIKGESYRLKDKRQAGTVPQAIFTPAKEEDKKGKTRGHTTKNGSKGG